MLTRTYRRCPACSRPVLCPGARACSRHCGATLRRDRVLFTAPWCVYRSDLRLPADELVSCHGGEGEARDEARRLNALELARHGGEPVASDGLPTPLYFVSNNEEE